MALIEFCVCDSFTCSCWLIYDCFLVATGNVTSVNTSLYGMKEMHFNIVLYTYNTCFM